jgi:KDO2-lipid IV(A) lauroyltransferase
MYWVLRYRKKVVTNNLRNAFPEKSDEEINRITKDFYHYLTDIFFESLKGMSLSRAQLEKRHKYINPEVVNQFLEQGRSIVGVTAHYGNWEWGAFSGATQFSGEMVAFYKPMKNRVIDRYMVKHRARFNCYLSSIGETYYTFRHYRNDIVTYFMVSDQSPSNLRRSYWFNFLNQDTAFIHGPEDYSRLYNLPVIFIEIRRIKRGYYEVHFSVLSENPDALPSGEITRLYAEKLESIIRKAPAYWLWSHRRWKRTRSDIRHKNLEKAQAS